MKSQSHFGSGHFLFKTPLASAECVRSVFCCAVVSVTIEHGQKQEVGSRRQSVSGRVEDDPQRPPSTTWFMATWNDTEFFIQPSKGGRVQSGKSTTPTVEQGREFLRVQGIQELRSPRRNSVQTNVFPRPVPGCFVWKPHCRCSGRTVPRVTNQGSIEEGTRSMSRFAHRRKIGLNSEIRPKVEGTDREDSRESATVARRSNQQCPRSLSKRPPTGSNDVENPVEEVRRLRAQVADLQQERASGQETDESRAKKALSVPTPALDVGPAHGVVGGSSRPSDVMQTLIDAAEFNVGGSSRCVIFPTMPW